MFNSNDILAIATNMILETNLSQHNVSSFNEFIDTGIQNIITKQFEVNSGKIKNNRTQTEIDRSIHFYEFRVTFNKTTLTKPQVMSIKQYTAKLICPTEALRRNLDYCANLIVSADILVIAYGKHDKEIHRKTANISNCSVSDIPIMVGCSLCNTYNMSRQQLLELGEDPTDTGGYFIIGGNEWSIVPNESKIFNYPYIYMERYKNEVVRLEFISKAGDSFENSFQFIIRLLKNGSLTISLIINRYGLYEIPFYMIYRICGFNTDRDIVKTIIYGNGEDKLSNMMNIAIDAAFDANIDNNIFKNVRNKHNVSSNLQALTECVYSDSITKFMQNMGIKDKKTSLEHFQTLVSDTINRKFLTHIGTNTNVRIKKMQFLGHLIRKMLLVKFNIIEKSDRDSYNDKRIHTSGIAYSKEFKTHFHIIVIQKILELVKKGLQSVSFDNLDLTLKLKESLTQDKLKGSLSQSLSSGQEDINVKGLSKRKTKIKCKINTSRVERENQIKKESINRSITTNNTSQANQTARSVDMRSVHPSATGFIDPVSSPDSGERVGLQKQLNICVIITGTIISSELLKNMIIEEPNDDIIPFNKLDLTKLSYLSKIFVNGDWIACTNKPYEMVNKYIQKRRNNEINRYITIFYNILSNEIYFWCDYGRPLRPLLIVQNNLNKIKDLSKFKQNLIMTHDILNKLINREYIISDLELLKCIEYISPQEQMNCYIAQDIDELNINSTNFEKTFTHCEIPQTLLGITTLSSPFANHSYSGKTIYQTNQLKKTCSIYAFNYPYRFDKHAFVQFNNEIPIVSTILNKKIFPGGSNVIIAIASTTGYNQEDSIIFNKASIDRGLFTGVMFDKFNVLLDENEEVCKPDLEKTIGFRQNSNYSKLDSNGIIKIGSVLEYGDIIIGKIMKVTKKEELCKDTSIKYQSHERAIVDDVFVDTNSDGKRLYKVKTRAYRPIVEGDKLSSRAGNKCVCAVLYQQSDMPYSLKTGVIPDIILNPHCVPTRMIISQLIESLYSKLLMRQGSIGEGSIFTKIDINEIGNELKKYGLDEFGREQLINGRTGESMRSLIFMGPTYYQRISKFVIDQSHTAMRGPTNSKLNQPIEGGAAKGGGYKNGEMETWTMCAHGTSRIMYEKLMDHSDGFNDYICRNCGKRAIVNSKLNIYYCKSCGSNSEINEVKSAWGSKYFYYMLKILGVNVKYDLETVKYED